MDSIVLDQPSVQSAIKRVRLSKETNSGEDVTPEVPRKQQAYKIISFTEQEHPAGVRRAQQIHGQCYLSLGFVKPEALDTSGMLREEIDQSRGNNVTYFLATSKRNPVSQATLRVVDLPTNGTLEDLPAYRHSQGVMEDKYLQQLIDHHARGNRVCEIAALSTTDTEAVAGSFELFREALQDAVCTGRPEIWMITFVPHAYQSLQAHFSETVIKRTSAKTIRISKEDNRISPEMELTPVLVQADKVLDNLLWAINEAASPAESKRLTRSLLFLADGLHTEHQSAEVASFVAQMSDPSEEKSERGRER